MSGHPPVQSSSPVGFSSAMDPAQQQEMNGQFGRTNWTSSPPRVPPGSQYPNILPSPLIYETRAAADDIRNNASHADHRWARYLRHYTPTNTPRFHPYFGGNRNSMAHAGPSNHYGRQQHGTGSPINNYPVFPSASSQLPTVLPSGPPAIDADRERSLTPTPSNVARQSRRRISHSPALSGALSSRVRSPATKRTPPNIPGASAAIEDATLNALWDQTCATAAQWTALGIVEPNDQNGQSVLMEWVERRPDAFYCKVPTSSGRCKVYNAKKDRILSHVRKDHLNFRPFRCRGVCGTPHCDLRFPSNSALLDHTATPTTCEKCGKPMWRQNYNDHIRRGCTSKDPWI